MLVITRYANESVQLQFGDQICDVKIILVEFGGRIKLGFEAPREVSITRGELVGTERGRPREPSPPSSGIGWGPQS